MNLSRELKAEAEQVLELMEAGKRVSEIAVSSEEEAHQLMNYIGGNIRWHHKQLTERLKLVYEPPVVTITLKWSSI